MKDLTKYYIDLSKCTEEQRKYIRTKIFNSEFPVATLTRHILENMIVRKFNGTPYLLINDLDHWKLDRTDMNKTELTYPEFIKLFEKPKTVSESLKEYFRNTPREQVVKDWESVSEFDNVNSPKVSELFEGGESKEVLQVKKSKALSFILGQIDKKIEQINEIDIAHTEGVLIGLKICKELWAQGTISHETIQEEIYHYQEELDNLNSNQ